MKKFASLMLALSLSLFTLGCGGEQPKPANKPATTPGTPPAAGAKTEPAKTDAAPAKTDAAPKAEPEKAK